MTAERLRDLADGWSAMEHERNETWKENDALRSQRDAQYRRCTVLEAKTDALREALSEVAQMIEGQGADPLDVADRVHQRLGEIHRRFSREAVPS